ncbi:MAG: LytTR family DNA-binding domain-containing protein [Chitinispirillia bacterium]|jgi:two-component system LytT family response regulator
MIKTLIADDENHARERLRELLSSFSIFEIVDEARDGNEALQKIITHTPQVVFLDINMPGISVFSSIEALQKKPIIIFQTAYSEYAADAFDINALDYLLKPVRRERLEKTVGKIQEKIAVQSMDKKNIIHDLNQSTQKIQDHISVKIKGIIKIIPTDDIVRISFEKAYCFIYTVENKFISDKYLNYYEKILKEKSFFRTSRNHIINLKYISVIHAMYGGSYSIELKNSERVDLSRRKANILKKLIDF